MCGSREDAEDLVQETYAKVLAKPRFLRRDDDLGYLLRVLHNVLVSRVRTEQRRPRTVELTPDEASAADPREGVAERRVESRELLSIVASLTPEHRDVLAAVDVAGLSYKEAGRALGVPEGTIMSRLFRARKKVVAALDSPV
jgi:RNA polymerase sigma-70 factor (ECF subfamily)